MPWLVGAGARGDLGFSPPLSYWHREANERAWHHFNQYVVRRRAGDEGPVPREVPA